MKTIDRRLSKLENRLGITHSTPRYLVLLMKAGQELGPADDAYIKHLDEAGLLPTSGFYAIDLSDGFLREKGGGSRSAQRPMRPVLNVVLDRA
jgi:hypothetical protein